MQIRSPSVQFMWWGWCRQARLQGEMQKISTALSEDPVQGGAVAAQCAVCGKAINARGRVRVTQTPGIWALRFGLV